MGVLLLCAVALATGCNVYALGDSNTCFGWPCSPTNWPDYVQQRADLAKSGWRMTNYGVPGMTAVRYTNPDGSDILSPFTGEPNYGALRLARLLAETNMAQQCRDLTFEVAAPKLVLALGTNDIGRSPSFAIVNALLALKAQAEAAAPCLKVYVATIPNQYGVATNDLLYVNTMLRMKVPPDRLIEFNTGFTEEYFWDGVHLNGPGHHLQADRAYPVLFPGT